VGDGAGGTKTDGVEDGVEDGVGDAKTGDGLGDEALVVEDGVGDAETVSISKIFDPPVATIIDPPGDDVVVSFLRP
jgi:hypothetical protein